MTRIVLLRRDRSTAKNTGVDVYANSIGSLLDENGIEYSEISMVMDLKGGSLNFLVNGLIKPFFSILKAVRKNDVFHATDDFCCIFFPIMWKKRKIVTFHHVISETDKDNKHYWFWRVVAKIGIRWADDIIAISSQTKKEIIETYGVDGSRIVVTPNGISKKFVTLDVDKKKYIGCTSTLMPRKNLHALLKIFKIFKGLPGTEGYTLKICGKGPEKDALMRTASELGIEEDLEILSDLSDDELVTFYNEAMVFANTSLHEGFGNMTLEAQICSTPVVYYRDADIPEEVVRFALPVDTDEEFAHRISDLIADPQMYADAVREGKEYADTFSGYPKGLLEVYLKQKDN